MTDGTPPRVAGAVAAINLKLYTSVLVVGPGLMVCPGRSSICYPRHNGPKHKIRASLSPEFATQVRDLILRVPDTTPYDTLKRQLIARTAVPQQRRLQQMFNSTELGDQRPTQLLRRMQQLLCQDAAVADGTLLRELFRQRLPANVRMILASSEEASTLEELAALGDRVMAVASPAVAGVNQSQPSEKDDLPAEV